MDEETAEQAVGWLAQTCSLERLRIWNATSSAGLNTQNPFHPAAVRGSLCYTYVSVLSMFKVLFPKCWKPLRQLLVWC